VLFGVWHRFMAELIGQQLKDPLMAKIV